MYNDYKILRDKGYTHEEACESIDKSERQMYRYRRRYNEERDFTEDDDTVIVIDDYKRDYLDKNLERFSKNKILLQGIRNEINTHTSELGRLEVFNEALVEEIKAYLDNRKQERYKFKEIVTKDGYDLYTVADTHLGSEVDLENNYYDIEICKARFEELTHIIINDIMRTGKERIGLAFFGDNVEGSNLRTSQLLKISKLIPEQTVEVIDIYERMIRAIAQFAEIDLYFILFDNHGRISLVTSNKENVPDNNMNIIISNMLLRLLKDVENVNWFIGDDLNVKINGLNIFMDHGHQSSTSDTFYKKFFNLRNKVDIYIHGHFHHMKYTSMSDLDVDRCAISLPSMIGPDDYSISIGASNKAASLKISFNEDGIDSLKKFTFTE